MIIERVCRECSHVGDVNSECKMFACAECGLMQNTATEPDAKFPIGTQYTTRGKAPRLCTVVDILRTYNSANELVSIRYVAEHFFAGQVITERDVCETTILMSHAHAGNPLEIA